MSLTSCRRLLVRPIPVLMPPCRANIIHHNHFNVHQEIQAYQALDAASMIPTGTCTCTAASCAAMHVGTYLLRVIEAIFP
jgi:hypothetical protein